MTRTEVTITETFLVCGCNSIFLSERMDLSHAVNMHRCKVLQWNGENGMDLKVYIISLSTDFFSLTLILH